MNSILVTFFCLGNALICLAYDPVVNGGENAENYRYNAGASLKVQLPCNLGRGTYGAGSLSVKNIRPSAKECLCKLKNTKPESEDNKSFQYFIKVSGITPDSLKCVPEAEGSTNVDASANVKLGFLEIPCSLGTCNYYLGYWTKQSLGASTRQCLCELGKTKIGSLIMSPYDLWVRATGINLWSPMCNKKNEEDINSTPAPVDGSNDSTPAPADGEGDPTPAPADGEGDSTPVPADGEGDSTPAPADGDGDSTPAPVDGEEDSTPAPADGEGDSTPVPADGEDDSTLAPADGEGDSTPAPADGEGDSTPAPTEEEGAAGTTLAPTTSAPPTLYNYEIDYSLIYAQKYDIDSYLSSGKYYWKDIDFWINFIDGISESNQPKFGLLVVNTRIDNEWWTIKKYTDFSFCQEYPENSMIFNQQKTIHKLIFGDKNGCAIEPGTNVTVPKKQHVSVTMDEKIKCGLNSLNVVLQSPDNKNAVGLYWSYNVPFSEDCIDVSTDEERERQGIKKYSVPYTFQNLTRDHTAVLDSAEVPNIDYNHNAKKNETTWFAFPNGFDSESNVIFEASDWYGSRFLQWNVKSSNLTTPCDKPSEYSLDYVYLRIFQNIVFRGQDCPIKKDTNLTIPIEYGTMDVGSNKLLQCGRNFVNINLKTSEKKNNVLNMIASWIVSNETECIDYSTY